MARDRIFADLQSDLEAFVFDERVTGVFADMVRRSVPGYATAVAMSGVLAGRFAQPGSNIYDLGCSLGATTLAMHKHLDKSDCAIIGVDNSQAMIDAARQACMASDNTGAGIHFVCADIRDEVIEDASVVAINYTLQFIPPAERDALVARIYSGMRPGGVLILSEKVVDKDPQVSERMTSLYLEFKRATGYSELEISQKRTALEKVLVPETEEQHRQRLGQSGFIDITRWFQCLNFSSWIACKPH
jgi:tRNA (cmo5U34)-methyltransferase